MSVKIVADSSANLVKAEIPNFASVPLKILAGGKEYVDDKDLDVSAMVRELHDYTGRSSSACPSPGEWFAAFGGAEQVFGVALTSAISGAYNAAHVAAEDYMAQYPGRKVFISSFKSAIRESRRSPIRNISRLIYCSKIAAGRLF